MTPEEVRSRAGECLIVHPDLDALHQALADEMVAEVARNNRVDRPTRLILPVGPTGQYPILTERVRAEGLSLRRCFFFFMDEYCVPDGDYRAGAQALPSDHPLSFKGAAQRLLLDRLPEELAPSTANVVFPDETSIVQLSDTIDRIGGIDTCYGGIGIHGHLAFNEPTPGVADTGPRRVKLNDYTVTINAIRAEVGGNIVCFPRYAYTLGMRQILSARRIVLACRNGSPYDWANTVLRLALFGRPGDDFPVTHIRGHDYTILTDEATLASPRHLI
jgi:glucosamine-6-phosphate deaminase